MTLPSRRDFAYALPLVRPWRTAGGELTSRRGRLIALTDEAGRTGWGDSAPFPAIGISPAQADRQAETCARLDLAAQAAGRSLAEYLKGNPAPRSIPVNAALGDLIGATPESVAAAAREGFTVLKLKVGLADPAEEAAHLADLATALPAAGRLRLDANQAWSPAQARAFLAALARHPALPAAIDSLEEPLAHPVAAALAELQAECSFPLALDESLPEVVDDDFLDALTVHRLVLKPARHGGLTASLDLARRAARRGIDCVITSSLESACGLLACAHLAAALPSRRNNRPPLAHGLATAHWFAADTGTPPAIVDGHLILPEGPGLSFQPGVDFRF